MHRYFAVPHNGTWTDWRGGPWRRHHALGPIPRPAPRERAARRPMRFSAAARLTIIAGSASSLWAMIGGAAYYLLA